MKGRGLVNSVINNLPFELHFPGYNFCGPGTKLEKRLQRGDKGVNPLDDACMVHDIAYSKFSDIENRNKADRKLLEMANQRITKSNSRGEKVASWIVSKVMKAKIKAGAGFKNFHGLIKLVRSQLKNCTAKDKGSLIKHAYKIAKRLVKNRKIQLPRVIPIPKTGGFLPLIPIFAGLSALGSLAGGAAGITQAVNNYKSTQKQLKESERHNKLTESILLGKGLYIKPYKSGSGLYLTPPKNF